MRTPQRNPDAGAYSERSRRAYAEASASSVGRYADGAYGASSRDPDRAQLRDDPLGAGATSKPAVDPDTLREVLTHLLADDEGARQIQVSPKRAIEKMQFLSEEKKRALLAVESEFMQQLGKAANKYKRAAQKYGPLGGSPKGGPMDRVDDLTGGRGSFGRPGGQTGFGPGWESFMPTGSGGLSRGQFAGIGHGRGVPSNRPQSGGGRGDVPSGGGAFGPGGLSRGQVTGIGLGGVTGGGAPKLPELGPGTKPRFGRLDFKALGAPMPGPLTSDPLVRASLHRRLDPAGPVAEQSAESDSNGKGNQEIKKDPDADPAYRAAVKEKWETRAKIESYVNIVLASTGLSGFFRSVLGVDPLKMHRPADDGTGSGGPAGPRSSGWMPADDGTGPIGPWLHDAGSISRSDNDEGAGLEYMPPPDGDGGWGPWAHLLMPTPDDAGPGTPTSRVGLFDYRPSYRSLRLGNGFRGRGW